WQRRLPEELPEARLGFSARLGVDGDHGHGDACGAARPVCPGALVVPAAGGAGAAARVSRVLAAAGVRDSGPESRRLKPVGQTFLSAIDPRQTGMSAPRPWFLPQS